jgi:hypothetical protein
MTMLFSIFVVDSLCETIIQWTNKNITAITERNVTRKTRLQDTEDIFPLLYY